MVGPALLGNIANTRLRHRVFSFNGKLHYLLSGDREAVELDSAVWSELSAEFLKEVARATKILKLAFLLNVPVIIATLALIVNIEFLKDLTDRIDRNPPWGAVLVVVILIWMPLAALLVHARIVRAAQVRLESRLMQLPRIPVPAKRPVFHQNLQVLVILLVGPAIVVRLLGTLIPDLYRNTPLSGAQLGWMDVFAALAVSGWLFTRPRTS